jgi:hypothetical protein
LKLEQWQQKDSERILDESCLRHVSLEIFDPPWNDLLPKKNTLFILLLEVVARRSDNESVLEVISVRQNRGLRSGAIRTAVTLFC